MPRPTKPLADHVRDGTFRARRHWPMLVGPVVPWSELAALQAEYAAASSDPERRDVALRFEYAVRELHAQGERVDDEAAANAAELDAIFAAPPMPMVEAAPYQLEPAMDPDRYYRAMRGLERWDGGSSVREIASELGVSQTTVRRDLAAATPLVTGTFLRPKRGARALRAGRQPRARTRAG